LVKGGGDQNAPGLGHVSRRRGKSAATRGKTKGGVRKETPCLFKEQSVGVFGFREVHQEKGRMTNLLPRSRGTQKVKKRSKPEKRESKGATTRKKAEESLK